MRIKEVLRWLSVQFVKKVLISELRSAILIEEPTECGSPTCSLYVYWLKTAEQRKFTFVLPAYVPVMFRRLN